MAYNNEYYIKAKEIIISARKKKLKEYNAMLSATYNAVPRLYEIDRTLSSIGAKAMAAAMAGNTQSIDEFKKQSDALQKEKNQILSEAEIIEPAFACPICQDTGLVNNKFCLCVKQLAKQLVFEDLSSKMPIENQNFDNFSLEYYSDKANEFGVSPKENMIEALEEIKDYAENFPNKKKSLIFIGGVGLGKTHLSMAIINAVIEKGFGVVYGPAQNLFSQVEKEHFSYSGSTEKLDAMLNSDLLVIDDLGTEISSSFTKNLLYNIINTRINSGLPTIISTNLSLSQLEKQYTSRVTSRIIGNFELIKFFGEDIRQQKALMKNI